MRTGKDTVSTSPLCAQTGARFRNTCKWHNGAKNSHKETDDRYPMASSQQSTWGTHSSSPFFQAGGLIAFCRSGVCSELYSHLVWVGSGLYHRGSFPPSIEQGKNSARLPKMDSHKTIRWMTCVGTGPFGRNGNRIFCSPQNLSDPYFTIFCYLKNQKSPNAKFC